MARGGRPKGHRPVISVIGAKRRVEMLTKLYEQAMSGDVSAAKLLLDRMDPTLARQELTGADGDAIRVEKPDLSHWSTEDLRELDALASKHEERATKTNGSGNGATQH